MNPNLFQFWNKSGFKIHFSFHFELVLNLPCSLSFSNSLRKEGKVTVDWVDKSQWCQKFGPRLPIISSKHQLKAHKVEILADFSSTFSSSNMATAFISSLSLSKLYFSGLWLVWVQWVQLHPQILRKVHFVPLIFKPKYL